MDPAAQTPSSTQEPPKSNKVMGWVLIAIGIIIIIGTAVAAISVFTGKASPPKVMSVTAPTISLPNAADAIDTSALPPEIAKSLKQTQNSQQNSFKIFSDEDISKLINIGIFYLLVMFLSTTGLKIASIGTQLTRDIKVSVKS